MNLQMLVLLRFLVLYRRNWLLLVKDALHYVVS
ncbi:hypothetical protein GLYMA_16G105350v4 [Glycine max]|nr:hypothetical protein GLYMA_16G105350v4 [Glycine max]